MKITVTRDEINSSRYEVESGDIYMGVVTDESAAGLSRGGWHAWFGQMCFTSGASWRERSAGTQR